MLTSPIFAVEFVAHVLILDVEGLGERRGGKGQYLVDEARLFSC